MANFEIESIAGRNFWRLREIKDQSGAETKAGIIPVHVPSRATSKKPAPLW
jgi:hypothetical protein